MNNYEYTMNIFIISLFLFLQEFTRMKWSENGNKEREKKIFLLCGGSPNGRYFGFSQIEGVNKVL